MKIGKVYIISLKSHDVNEQNIIKSKLDKCNFNNSTPFQIVQAWDGRSGIFPKNISIYNNWRLKSDSNRWWSRDILPGEVGCALSHFNIWKDIVNEEVSNALILEDDFLVNAPLGSLDEPKNKDWDLLYLGREIIEKDIEEKKIDELWVLPRHSYNSHAYILSLDGAKKMLEYSYDKNIIPVDEFISATVYPHRRKDILKLFPNKLNAFAYVDPNIIVQNRTVNESTIEVTNQEPIDFNYFEILDTSDWEDWKHKYIDSILLKGEYDLMIDDLTNNIYEFQLFTKEFCRELVQLSEYHNNWTTNRHDFYPTNDILLSDINLQTIYNRVLSELVYPLCIHIWSLEGIEWSSMRSENFVARYTVDNQSHLSLHHDSSHITMVVKLNSDYDGGGTWFPKYKVLSNPEREGVATLHPGMITHLHGARPIYSGKRYICVSFMSK